MAAEKLARTSYRDEDGDPRDGATSLAESRRDMEEHLLPLLRVHASALHGPGVATELAVTATSGGTTVTVGPGVAVDPVGRHLSLAPGGHALLGTDPDPVAVTPTGIVLDLTTLSPAPAAGPHHLTLTFTETFDALAHASSGGTVFELDHTPRLALHPAATPAPDAAVVLARVTLAANRTVTALDPGTRRTPTGELTVTRSLVTPDPADPTTRTVTDEPVGGLTAHTDGGLSLTGIDTHTDGPLTVHGTLTTDGPTNLLGDTTVDGLLISRGALIANDALAVRQGLSVDGSLTVRGPLEAQGGLTVADNTLDGATLRDGTVPGAKLAVSSLPGTMLIDNSLPGAKLQARSVPLEALAAFDEQNTLTVPGNIGARLVLQDTRVNGGRLELSAGSNIGTIFVAGPNPLWLGNNNRAKIVIEANGNVGIGNPQNGAQAPLHVGGQVLSSAGFCTGSSRRWKTNVRPLDGALDAVARLQGVSFRWAADGRRDIGLIAEDVGRVVPEVVTHEDDGTQARGLDYGRLTSLLIEAIKEQQREIEALRDMVTGRLDRDDAEPAGRQEPVGPSQKPISPTVGG